MARLYSIEIENFRGIKSLSHTFGKENLYCFIGQGDSGKSTILEAIFYAMCPLPNETFNDGDFHKCDLSKAIHIRATLIDIPTEFATDRRFYEYLKSYSPEEHKVYEEIDQDVPDGQIREHAITVELSVTKELEPEWQVTCNRHEEGKTISHGDRKKLNIFVVSDSVDRHFQWSRWNPLYFLHSRTSAQEADDTNIVLEVLRNAKETLDSNPFGQFSKTMEQVVALAKKFGMDLPDTKTTIDYRDIVVKDGRFSLHDDVLPFRLKGKGSKRLISMAIQSALCEDGGIMLIDEIEQSLESFRVKHAVGRLQCETRTQTFITTHSNHVLEELGVACILLVRKDNDKLVSFSNECNGLVRSNPQAFFHNRVIVCEGRTEIGVCRALDRWLQGHRGSSFALRRIGIVDGNGSELVSRCRELRAGEFETILFCDSDEKVTNEVKGELVNIGIEIADFAAGQSIESAAIEALPEAGLKDLLKVASTLRAERKGIELKEAKRQIWESLQSYIQDSGGEDGGTGLASEPMRIAMTSAARGKKWFKTVAGGEAFGHVLLEHVDIETDAPIAKALKGLVDWVERA